VTTFAGKEKLLQTHVHDEIDRMIPLKSVRLGFRLSRLREGLENIIYSNRFERTDPERDSLSIPELPSGKNVAELDATPMAAELQGDHTQVAELPAEVSFPVRYSGINPDTKSQTTGSTTYVSDRPSWDDASTLAPSMSNLGFRTVAATSSNTLTSVSPISPMTPTLEKQKSGGAFSRSMKAMGLRKFSSKNALSKTKTG